MVHCLVKNIISYTRPLAVSPRLIICTRKSQRGLWSELLQNFVSNSTEPDGKEGSEQMQIAKLQSQLKYALATRRSHLKGDFLPHVTATEVCQFYLQLSDLSDKATFFKLISHELGIQIEEVRQNMDFFLQEGKEYGQLVKANERLHHSLTPSYKYLLTEIGRLAGGVKFLVDMRRDLLELTQSRLLSRNHPTVQIFDKYLKDHLAQWFAAGFLDLEQVTWDSGASFLEKIINAERVHKMWHLEDLKQRVGRHRRCYTFTHRLLPGEPLVVLHTALCHGLPSSIQDVLVEDTVNSEKAGIDTAAFYSISSTQPGLAGIDLGNFLIKNAVQKLQNDFPHIYRFGTLSPIPGFRKWLDFQLDATHTSDSIVTWLHQLDLSEIKSRIQGCSENSSPAKLLKVALQTFSHDLPFSVLRKPLLQLCARYLLVEKRRNFAFDSVANFHLRNGAILWRLNWLGDTSDNGMKSSYGIMVNYKYDLDLIEENNRAYLMSGHIAVSEDVENLSALV